MLVTSGYTDQNVHFDRILVFGFVCNGLIILAAIILSVDYSSLFFEPDVKRTPLIYVAAFVADVLAIYLIFINVLHIQADLLLLPLLVLYILIFIGCAMYGFSKYLINSKISNVAQDVSQHEQTSFSIKRSMVNLLKAVYFICSSAIFANIFLVFVENKMSSRNNKSFSEPTHWQRDSFHGHDESLPSSKFKFWQSARQFMKNSENDKDLLLRICCINYIVTNFCVYDDEKKDSVAKVNMDEQDDNKNDENNQEIQIAKRGVASTFAKYLHFDFGLLSMIQCTHTRVESQYLAKIYRDNVFVDYIYQSASRHLYQNIESLTDLCKNTQFMFDLTTLTQGNTNANDIDANEVDSIINISSMKDHLFQKIFLMDRLCLRILFGSNDNMTTFVTKPVLFYLFLICKILSLYFIPFGLFIYYSVYFGITDDSFYLQSEWYLSLIVFVLNIMVFYLFFQRLSDATNNDDLLFYYIYPMNDQIPTVRVSFDFVLNHYSNIQMCRHIRGLFQEIFGQDVARLIEEFISLYDQTCLNNEYDCKSIDINLPCTIVDNQPDDSADVNNLYLE